MLEYDFGSAHPMAPLRLDLTFRLARELGVLDLPGVDVVGAEPADDAVLGTAHDPEYVAAVRRASALGEHDLDRGLGTEDDPVFPGMHDAAARQVTGSVESALEVWRGEARHAVNLAGGMHHAMAGHASGFCVYNDVVAAIRAVLEEGAERMAYVDLDAHHGDGVERAFWDDPRVLTISIHESGHTLFPGTGHATDVGGPHARGSVVNVALPAGTADAGWLRAVGSVALPLLAAFRPQMIVSQHGCDAHGLDPLTNLAVSVDAQRVAAEAVHRAVHEVADGRWLALGGGGYAIAQVVPRVWTHLLAIAAHEPIEAATAVPEPWRERVAAELGFPAPTVMGDGGEGGLPRPWSEGFDPAEPVDRVVLAARRAVFDWHGLDAVYD
jgi:acetoin utilization protein AcuC